MLNIEDLITKYDTNKGFQHAVSQLLSRMDKEDTIEQLTGFMADIVYSTAYDNDMNMDDGSNVRIGIENHIMDRLTDLFATDVLRRTVYCDRLAMRIVNHITETVGTSVKVRQSYNDALMDYVENILHSIVVFHDMNDKPCKITNGNFSWALEVDGASISFQSADAAQYFVDHYRQLGYSVEIDDRTKTVK